MCECVCVCDTVCVCVCDHVSEHEVYLCGVRKCEQMCACGVHVRERMCGCIWLCMYAEFVVHVCTCARVAFRIAYREGPDNQSQRSIWYVSA